MHASFTDQATATESVKVGTFAINLTSTTPNVVGSGTKALTLSAPDLLSSAAGSQPLTFQVNNTGSIDAQVTITAQDTLTSEFTDTLSGLPITVTVPAGGHTQVYTGGLQWGELSNASLGKTEQVKYVVSATDH